MTTDLVIARLGSALAALGEAKTIQDTKAILDVATAATIYARRQKLSEENIAFANEVKFEAMRQLGELLKAAPKNAGARGVGKSGVTQSNPTLSDQGIDKRTSATAQKLADLPPEKFQAVKSGEMSLSKATAKPKTQGNKNAPTPDALTTVLEPDDDIPTPPDEPASGGEEEEAEQAAIEAAQFKADFAIFYADDQNRHMVDQIRQLTAEVVSLRSRVTGLMGELSTARGLVKSWRAKAEKAERERF